MNAEHEARSKEIMSDLAESLQEAHQEILSLRWQITELRWIETALRERTRELSERVKELDCLYAISDCLGKPTRPLNEILQAIANTIPAGFQFPKDTSVALRISGHTFCSRGFRQSAHTRYYELVADGRSIGNIQVFVSPAIGPAFLPEEDNLLRAIAKWIGEIVEHREGSLQSKMPNKP